MRSKVGRNLPFLKTNVWLSGHYYLPINIEEKKKLDDRGSFRNCNNASNDNSSNDNLSIRPNNLYCFNMEFFTGLPDNFPIQQYARLLFKIKLKRSPFYLMGKFLAIKWVTPLYTKRAPWQNEVQHLSYLASRYKSGLSNDRRSVVRRVVVAPLFRVAGSVFFVARRSRRRRKYFCGSDLRANQAIDSAVSRVKSKKKHPCLLQEKGFLRWEVRSNQALK